MTKIRKNLVVSESFNRKLEILTELTGAPTEAETFRRAVDLYMRLMKLQLSGDKIIVQNQAGASSSEGPLYDFFKVRKASKASPEIFLQLGLNAEAVKQAQGYLTIA